MPEKRPQNGLKCPWQRALQRALTLTQNDCCDAAYRWGDRDNQEMQAKAIMRWTCASCREPKDVQFGVFLPEPLELALFFDP